VAERALEAAEAARGGDGGAIRVRVDCKHMATPGRWGDLLVRVGGKNLHAPVLENLLDIPMDVYGGRLDGEVRLRCADADTWDFPELSGTVRGRGLGFHFFDAPDDFAGVDLDLLFEGRRLYLHGASGFYGAIPLTATGDIDITPELGEYHVSANIPLVDANSLRETLGGRPPPSPLAGALRGSGAARSRRLRPHPFRRRQGRVHARYRDRRFPAARGGRAPRGRGPRARLRHHAR
jgi:hypothetical protein